MNAVNYLPRSIQAVCIVTGPPKDTKVEAADEADPAKGRSDDDEKKAADYEAARAGVGTCDYEGPWSAPCSSSSRSRSPFFCSFFL